MAGISGATLMICSVNSEQLERMLLGIGEIMPTAVEATESVSSEERKTPENCASYQSPVWPRPASPRSIRRVSIAQKSLKRLTMAVGADRCEIQSPVQKPREA